MYDTSMPDETSRKLLDVTRLGELGGNRQSNSQGEDRADVSLVPLV